MYSSSDVNRQGLTIVVANSNDFREIIKLWYAGNLCNIVSVNVQKKLLQECPSDDVLATDGIHGRDDKVKVIDPLRSWRIFALVNEHHSRTVE